MAVVVRGYSFGQFPRGRFLPGFMRENVKKLWFVEVMDNFGHVVEQLGRVEDENRDCENLTIWKKDVESLRSWVNGILSSGSENDSCNNLNIKVKNRSVRSHLEDCLYLLKEVEKPMNWNVYDAHMLDIF